MKKILFVDDERSILDGLKRMLRGQRHEWDMTFVNDGKEAIAAMNESSYDVIISDMRMPRIDGAALLSWVQRNHPETVRVVLSGHSELESAMRAACVAHQFLSKPCDSAVIREVVTRACALQDLLHDRALQEVIGGVDTLPAIPRVYNQLVKAMGDPEVGLDEVTRIVSQDPGITAKMLQLVNSSFFGTARAVVDIRQAVTCLGLSMVRNLALTTEVFRSYGSADLPRGFDLEREQEHATLTARLARRIAPDTGMADTVFLASMLHDMGKVLLATVQRETFSQALEQSGPGLPLYVAEERLLGVSHAEIGAYLLGIWGMPYPVVEAVANHHKPRRVPQESFGPLGVVHVANGLAVELTRAPEESEGAIDEEYLRQMGMLGHLPAWRESALAERQAQQEEAA